MKKHHENDQHGIKSAHVVHNNEAKKPFDLR